MRIALIEKRYQKIPQHVGSVNAQALFDELNKLGHDAWIIYFSKDQAKVPQKYLGFLKALRKKFDVVYASSPTSRETILAFLFALTQRKTLYLSIFESSLTGLKHPLIKPVFRLLVKIGFIVPFAMTKAHQKKMARELGIKAQILEPCLRRKKSSDIKKRSKYTLLTRGLWHTEGGRDILKAYVSLKEKIPSLTLRSLTRTRGGKKEILRMNQGIAKVWHVKLTADIYQEFTKAALFIAPITNPERGPVIHFTILEAIYLGCPVITSETEFTKEILPKKYLISDVGKEILSKKILQLIKNPPKNVKLPKSFLPENVVNKFINILLSPTTQPSDS